MREAQSVDENFPNELKAPVLNIVQTSDATRLDALVEQIYHVSRWRVLVYSLLTQINSYSRTITILENKSL